MGTEIRCGYVSSYDAKNNSASIYYPHRNGETTQMLPVLAPFGAAQTLKKDDCVLAIHMSGAEVDGVVLGRVDPEAVTLGAMGGDLSFNISGGGSIGGILSKIAALERRVSAVEKKV